MGTNNVGGMIGEGAESLVNTLLILLIIVLLLIGALVYLEFDIMTATKTRKFQTLRSTLFMNAAKLLMGRWVLMLALIKQSGILKSRAASPNPNQCPKCGTGLVKMSTVRAPDFNILGAKYCVSCSTWYEWPLERGQKRLVSSNRGDTRKWLTVSATAFHSNKN